MSKRLKIEERGDSAKHREEVEGGNKLSLACFKSYSVKVLGLYPQNVRKLLCVLNKVDMICLSEVCLG